MSSPLRDVKPPAATVLTPIQDSPEKTVSSHNKTQRKAEELSKEVRKLSESYKMKKDTAVKVTLSLL